MQSSLRSPRALAPTDSEIGIRDEVTRLARAKRPWGKARTVWLVDRLTERDARSHHPPGCPAPETLGGC